MRARRYGFTLLELLVVVAIIAVLATLILGGLASARRRTQIAVARNNIAALKAALQMYETDTGRYPTRPTKVTDKKYFNNDITFVYAALRNRRTLQFGGGPNSPYLDWKPEQVGKVSFGDVGAYNFGVSNDGSGSGSTNQLKPASGSNYGDTIMPDEFDQVMANDITWFNGNWSNIKPDGSQALAFLDPWGNPYVYVEWASVPQADKDTQTQTINSNPSGSGSATESHVLRPHDPSKFDIYSFGPNGVNEGGEGDDVAAWMSTQKR